MRSFDSRKSPDTGARDLFWRPCMRLQGPQDSVQERWANELDQMRVKLQSATETVVAGSPTTDFHFRDWYHHPEVQRDGVRLSQEMLRFLGRDSSFEGSHALAGWSFFGTHLPSLRANPDLVYGTTQVHADDVDPAGLLNGLRDSPPFIIWNAPSLPSVRSRLLVPSDFEESLGEYIPSLSVSFPYPPDSEQMKKVLALIEKGKVRFHPFVPGDFYRMWPSALHDREPLPEHAIAEEGWRYSHRLNLAGGFFF